MRFKQLNERGIPVNKTYKYEESVLSFSILLAKDQDNLVAPSYLKSLIIREDIVENLTLEIRLHELDPDCSSNRWRQKSNIFNKVSLLADN